MRDFKSLVLLRSRTSTVNFLLAKTEFPARLGAGNFPVTAWKDSPYLPGKVQEEGQSGKIPC